MGGGGVSGCVVFKTPAKVNLRLRVLGLRGDGYHEIMTWMQQVSLYDEICIEPCENMIYAHADRNDVPDGKANIVHRAASVLREASGRDVLGARIYLKKNIPVDAGLGGGSGNAAGTLWALNQLWGLNMDKKELMEVAARVGSDVPFFLHGPAAVCRGRGERIEEKEALKSGWFLLIKPPIRLSTRNVYAWSRSKLREDRRGFDGREVGMRLRRCEYGNDLEAVVFSKFPNLENLRTMLLHHGAQRAMMSGSGSTIFGVFRQKGEAERAAISIQKSERGEFFIAKPLREMLYIGSDK